MNSTPTRIILLDTSFILALVRARSRLDDWIHELGTEKFTIATTDGVAFELERLARNGRFPSKALAERAITLLANQRVVIRETLPATPSVDTGLLASALGDKGRVDVATVDHDLGASLSKQGIVIIGPRYKGGISVKTPHSASLK